jgi:hypothetical protein
MKLKQLEGFLGFHAGTLTILILWLIESIARFVAFIYHSLLRGASSKRFTIIH